MLRPRFDSHASVYRPAPTTSAAPDLAEVDGDFDAAPATFMGMLDAHGLDGGVLVQAAHLCTDNTFLCEALQFDPHRLRGVARVDQSFSAHDLERLTRAGVVAILLDVLDSDVRDLARPDMQILLARIIRLGWHIEVAVRGRDVPAALAATMGRGAPVVIHHFGMPTPGSPSDCPGLTAIAALKPTDQVFVKLSATYLSPDMDITTVRNLLFSTLGAGRLLWGSDWPWPRHSAQRSYAMEMARSLGAAPAEAIEAMDAAAAWLYRF